MAGSGSVGIRPFSAAGEAGVGVDGGGGFVDKDWVTGIGGKEGGGANLFFTPRP